MDLYDGIIKSTVETLSQFTPVCFQAGCEAWEETDRNQLLFSSDTAYELGGSGKQAVSYQAITTSKNCFDGDKIFVFGKDLNQLKQDTNFAKIVLFQVDTMNEDAMKLYNAIKEIELVQYEIFPKGYMPRISVFDKREQVRVSKEAVKKDITFEKIGNTIINRYKQNPSIVAATVIFITDDIPVFSKLQENAKKVDEITLALNHVLTKMNYDCSHCDLRLICNEIEGLRKLHKKNSK